LKYELCEMHINESNKENCSSEKTRLTA
jgi:hypothetical protein